MFYDEARFGRCSSPRRCWAPSGVRPTVSSQLIRGYTYAYGAISPADGIGDFLILPTMTGEAMNLFLEELSHRHQKELILLIGDCAPSHTCEQLLIPDNICLKHLPPYCPELNPTENIWDDIREKFFPNFFSEQLSEVENQLVRAALFYENHPEVVASITRREWIVSNILNAN